MPKKKEELLKEAKSEVEYFNREYAEDDDKQRVNNLIVPERFIRRVMNPDPRPLKEFEYPHKMQAFQFCACSGFL